MPNLKPFKAVVYDRGKIKDISKVVAPPYDIISKAMQKDLYKRHPNNIVRLILGRIKKSDTKRDNRYTRARAFLDDWLRKKILSKDKKEAIYVYSQVYEYAGKRIERTGFISLMELESGGGVLPHENTLAAPKADRLNLMRSVKANLSPIFVLYDDGAHQVVRILKDFFRRARPFINITVAGARHRVCRMDDEKAVRKIRSLISGKDMFIADGHHRYETAKNFHVELQGSGASESVKAASGYIMVYFVESDEKMLTILPAHRVVKDTGDMTIREVIDRLKPFFFIEKARSLKSVMGKLEKLSKGHAFGMYKTEGGFYILKLKSTAQSDKVIKDKSLEWKHLDVSILHLFILQDILGIRDEDDNIEFFKDPCDAIGSVDRKEGEMAFLLNPTKVSQVKRIAILGERMPRKATYFYPKPLSGLVIYKF